MSRQPELGFAEIPLNSTDTITNNNTRHIKYWVLAIVLLMAAVSLQGINGSGSVQLHTLLEVIATVLALFVGIMATLRYTTRKDIIYLMIGCGFIGTFLLDGYHGIVTSEYFKPYMPSNLPALIPWSWLASRQLLSIFLFMSWLLWKVNFHPDDDYHRFERALFIIGGLFTVAVFCFFAFAPLPPAYNADMLFQRPADLVPCVFFTIALYGYLTKGKWRTDSFEHWLVYALIFSTIGQAIYMARSTHVFDLYFDLAHVVKIGGYLCVLMGLMSSMFEVFQREQKSGQILAGAVRKAKEKERDAVVESIHHGVTLYDKKFQLVVCNLPFIELMAVNPDSAKPGADIESLFVGSAHHSDPDQGKGNEQRERAQLERVCAFSPIHYRRVLSNEKVVEIIGTPVPMGYVITYNDVSELVGAQQDAIKTSDKLIEILETSPVGIGITTAEDHSIRWINSCGAKLLGFNSRGDVLGYSAQNCWISPEQRATFVDTFAKNGSVKAREVQLKNSLGNPFWCYLSWDKIHFENEDCILYWMFDITLKKEVQRQLFDSEKLASLGRLVAGVAHEINTPIGVGITATTYMLQQTENFFDVLNSNTLSKRGLKTYLTSTREGLDITFNNLKSAAHLVESFKQVSVDRISEKPRIIGLLDYFKDIIQSLHPKIKKAGVKVNLNSESDCSFYTYPGALSQIIANLISNSIIHGLEDKTDGIIDIQLSGKVGKAIKIQYQDNGVGIAENILFKVMDPFFTTKRNNGGTGLGLSIVHNIVVDKLHGTIKLTSTKGKGIKVAITIPSLSVKRPQPSLVEQKPLTHR